MTHHAISMTLAVLVVTASSGASTPALAQSRAETMGGTVGQWWGMIQRSFVGLAEAMPEDRYGFKPTDGAFKDVRTFAEQVKHVACANMGFFNEIERKTPPANCGTGRPEPARTKAELLTYLKDSFSYGDRVIRETTPSNALDPVDGPYGGPSTRLGIATLAVWHASDQLRAARRLRADEQHRSAGERALEVLTLRTCTIKSSFLCQDRPASAGRYQACHLARRSRRV